MIKRYIDTPGGQVHARIAGEGRTLLLLHQSPSSGAMWEPILSSLARQGFRAVAIDMPGYGASYRPETPPSMASYATESVAVLDALAVAQSDIVGHHTGASVALQIAADHPSRVRRLALWGVPLLDAELQRRLETEPPPMYDDAGSALTAFWTRRRELSGRAYTPELGVRALIEMLQTGVTRPWGHWAVAKTDHVALLKQVRHPTLVMAGSRDPVWPTCRRAADYLSDGRFVELGDAGLDVIDEAPSRFVEEVVNFLR